MSEPLPSPEPVTLAPVVAASPRRPWPMRQIAAGALLVLLATSLWMAWSTQARLKKVEQELVRRQQSSQSQSDEARLLAKQAHEASLESAAKVALLEARLAEVSLQRSQLEDLIQSLSRSRDENVLGDIDAALRVAQQQSALTGSAEPLVAALKQADERLARHNQPRLERVRRAIAHDLDRVKAVNVSDVAVLAIKLDEAVRLVDELPLLSQAVTPKETQPTPAAVTRASMRSAPVASAPEGWTGSVVNGWNGMIDRVWGETRALVRVTRINHPEAMLLAPEQSFFLRENLKLRLLNARLALLSRQFDSAKSDLQGVEQMLARYFDRDTRRTQLAVELVRQVATGAQQAPLPRPDQTLAALAAASAGR